MGEIMMRPMHSPMPARGRHTLRESQGRMGRRGASLQDAIGGRDGCGISALPSRVRAIASGLCARLPGWGLLLALAMSLVLVTHGPSLWRAAGFSADEVEELLAASAGGDLDGVRQALDRGVSADAAESGESALMVAATPEIARLLIVRGAHVDRAVTGLDTPLVQAIMCRRVAVVRALLDAGADPNFTSARGPSPLQAARSIQNRELIDLLLEYGAHDTARRAREP